MRRPFILGGTYFPKHDENRMRSEGDVASARKRFLRDRFPNLDYLLYQRYSWMNDYIKDDDIVLEIGCGPGFSPLYLIPQKKPILTDAVKHEWVDRVLDATSMDMADESLDVIIASHTIHHFYSPFKFFMESLRVLKPGGLICVQEINASLLMRVMLRLMRHEGWSYEVDVFNGNERVNDNHDPWSANCAVPQMLFADETKFNQAFCSKNAKLVVKLNQLCECFIFPLSGGVIAKTKIPPLPRNFLKFISMIDMMAIKICPNVFALGRRVVIQKKL